MLGHQHIWAAFACRGGIPAPERQSEIRIIDKFSKNSLMEVEIQAVQREEKPRIMNLEPRIMKFKYRRCERR